jgi:hypothetical protein
MICKTEAYPGGDSCPSCPCVLCWSCIEKFTLEGGCPGCGTRDWPKL